MLLQPTNGEMLVAYEGDYQPFCYESESETSNALARLSLDPKFTEVLPAQSFAPSSPTYLSLKPLHTSAV